MFFKGVKTTGRGGSNRATISLEDFRCKEKESRLVNFFQKVFCNLGMINIRADKKGSR